MSFQLSQPAITDSIYRTIRAAFTESPMTGLPAVHGSPSAFLAYAWPGANLNETAYTNPWSPNNASGSQWVTENISELVNSVPLLSEAYTNSGNTVEQAYQLILMASPVLQSVLPLLDRDISAAAGASSLAAVRGLVSKGKSIARQVEDKIADERPDTILEMERQYANASANLIAHRLQYDLTDPVGRQAWEAVAPNFEAAVRAAWGLLKEHEAASVGDRVTRESSTNPVASMLSIANQAFDRIKLSSLRDPGKTYHPSYVSPADFADPMTATNWAYAPSIKVTTPGNVTPNLKISFRFCRVDIRRPWLDMNILQMRGWRIEGQPSGILSTGDATNNDGSFPLLPVHFVVARDMTITGNGDDVNTVYFSTKGLQILAWINRVTPYMPPAS